jgi:hypothetical protein
MDDVGRRNSYLCREWNSDLLAVQPIAIHCTYYAMYEQGCIIFICGLKFSQ